MHSSLFSFFIFISILLFESFHNEFSISVVIITKYYPIINRVSDKSRQDVEYLRQQERKKHPHHRIWQIQQRGYRSYSSSSAKLVSAYFLIVSSGSFVAKAICSIVKPEDSNSATAAASNSSSLLSSSHVITPWSTVK